MGLLTTSTTSEAAANQVVRRLQSGNVFQNGNFGHNHSSSFGTSNFHDDRFSNTFTDTSLTSDGSGGTDHSRDAYEFVAFLLWYLFLVLCCVIPTCLAYRRRRLVEARIAQQQASVNRIERQNLFILSSLRHSSHPDHTERIKEQRMEKITEKLEATTMTVQEENLVERSDQNEVNFAKASCCVVKVTDDIPSPTALSGDAYSEDEMPVAPTLSVDFDLEADCDNTHVLRIFEATRSNTAANTESVANNENTDSTSSINQAPAATPTSTYTTTSSGSRLVPGACAICLCPYEIQEKVSWSPMESCQHAFHTDCIIPWLAKSDEPKCPCCRQDYCDAIPLSQLDLGVPVHAPIDMSRLFVNPVNTSGGSSFDANGSGVMPNFIRSLEASRLEFLTSLELATVEASARAREVNTLPSRQSGVATLGGSPFETILSSPRRENGPSEESVFSVVTTSVSAETTPVVELESIANLNDGHHALDNTPSTPSNEDISTQQSSPS